ncbi:MAG: hypothetical protein ABIG45_04825, partial [Bacillota bacterium]
MDFGTIASIVGLSSLISILVNLIFGHIEKKKMLRFEKITQEKQNRYMAMLSFMLIVLDIKNQAHVGLQNSTKEAISNLNPIDIVQYFRDELEAHYSYSHLYAADTVLSATKEFIDNP